MLCRMRHGSSEGQESTRIHYESLREEAVARQRNRLYEQVREQRALQRSSCTAFRFDSSDRGQWSVAGAASIICQKSFLVGAALLQAAPSGKIWAATCCDVQCACARDALVHMLRVGPGDISGW